MADAANRGFSLRQSLTQNGVTSEEAMRQHLHFVYGTVQGNPQVRTHRYRPNPKNPNNLPTMG